MQQSESTGARELCLIIRVGRHLYALPIESVAETMRPQSVRPISGTPPFVRGVAAIRGVPVPVVDAASAFAADAPSSMSQSTRFVSLKTAGRWVALAVDEVLGVRHIDQTQLSAMPPLLAGANDRVVSAIGMLDGELLIVLRSGKVVPDPLWAAMEAERG